MQIHATANLILTAPRSVKADTLEKVMLEAEQEINRNQSFIMPETKTQVGVRIHIQRGEVFKK